MHAVSEICHEKLKSKLNAAHTELRKNIVPVCGYEHPVLIEGGDYQGIWLECGPHEGLIYAEETGDISVAIANHDIFFHHQRTDGQFPCWIRTHTIGFAQIQMVVPIAFTALQTAKLSANEGFLEKAYTSCSRWDQWLRDHRNTRGTGLCEAFCELDTGHDRSPRFHGLPLKCRNDEASTPPDTGTFPLLPLLAPDLSATLYQGRIALAEMATLLGRPSEADRWNLLAMEVREALDRYCYDPEVDFYFDCDAKGNHIKVRGDVISRIFFSRILSQARFDRIFDRHIKDPHSFWTPYPLPSIAADDPLFNADFSHNSWNGASQALTALRSTEWFEYYGKTEDHHYLMSQWVSAIIHAPEFMQQMNPWTGLFNTSPAYSPCMLALIRFANRLGLVHAGSLQGASPARC